MIGCATPRFSPSFQTKNSSGVTSPFTIISPRPHEALIRTTFGKPDSVSSVNITPEHALSERTIFCTPTESAIFRWSNPRSARYEIARSVNKDAIVARTATKSFSVRGSPNSFPVRRRSLRPGGPPPSPTTEPPHRHLCRSVLDEIVIGARDIALKIRRKTGFNDGIADHSSPLREIFQIFRVQSFQCFRDINIELRAFQEIEIGRSRHDESRRYRHAFRLQSHDHFSKGRVLPSDLRNILNADFFVLQNIFLCLHGIVSFRRKPEYRLF